MAQQRRYDLAYIDGSHERDDVMADSLGVWSMLNPGGSIIWDSPFGPLRFDLAYPILKQPYDRTQVFQFGGGTRF